MTVNYDYYINLSPLKSPAEHGSIGSCCALRYKIYIMKKNTSPQCQKLSEQCK